MGFHIIGVVQLLPQSNFRTFPITPKETLCQLAANSQTPTPVPSALGSHKATIYPSGVAILDTAEKYTQSCLIGFFHVA